LWDLYGPQVVYSFGTIKYRLWHPPLCAELSSIRDQDNNCRAAVRHVEQQFRYSEPLICGTFSSKRA